ncbi:transcription activator [Rhynchospora pubera]|uniref:Transcription activator n=1 Tax=Rhynchospora pubera TaxID=906938 RepID=A0AAV8F3N8_9POAL|nr:transcription activator [Rhynchospora pubera]
MKYRESESMSRWSEYLNTEEITSPSTSTSTSWKNNAGTDSGAGGGQKTLQLESVIQLSRVAEGLLTKMYRLFSILDYPDSSSHTFSENFWKAGIIPNFPKLCVFVSKKFPEHPSKLQLERVDKMGIDALHENAEGYFQNLEPWVMLLLDLIAFREQALRLILDLSSTVITLLPHQNSLILHAFMDLFCSFVRVNLFSEKIPRKMMLQVYNILHNMLKGGRDCDFYHRLVQFIDSYDPPVQGLQEDLNFVSPRIGEVLEAVGPIIFLSTDTKKLRNEGFLSPFHPRYPDILTNSAHPMRAQDLANVTSYREWVLLGYLVCPDELLRVTSIDIAMVVLKEHLILPLFRDEYVLLHENYQYYVLPKIIESKRMAKSGRAKQKEADLEYNVAKQVEKMLSEVHEQALLSSDAIHHERRILLKQEIGRMVLFFTDQPSLLAPNIQMVFSALALAQSEIVWYFQHIGVASSSSKPSRVKPTDIDAADPTIGFLLDGMDKLSCLVRKYVAAIKGYALSYLLASAGRIRFLLGTPGMVALDLDATLKGLFQQVLHCLENVPKLHGENIPAVTYNLSDLRKHWLSILMIVTSSRSSINIRHLEKATVSTGKEGLVSEGNSAYNWSRCVDELEIQLSKHGSLKKLYFYHQHLTAVFRNTMFGPEGRPQHCCAWLGVASSFPECASTIVPEEINKIGRDAIMYVESLIESIMGGLEGLINILDSEGGIGSLEMQLLPEQAASRLNNTMKMKVTSGLLAPGHESYPENSNSIKMLEAAIQRLTSLCSVLNDMEPICVLNHVFVLREYMRDCIIGNFKRRLHAVLRADTCLQRPSIMESLLRRHLSIVHLAEQHISMDLTEGVREVLLAESFTGPISNLHFLDKPVEVQPGSAIEVISNWYIDHIVKDVTGSGVIFDSTINCFKSSQPIGGLHPAESFTNPTELKSLIRLFGGYGFDKFDCMLRELAAALLNCIDTALRSNRESLEAVAVSVSSGDRIEREANLRQILDIEPLVGFCIQAGQAIAFRKLLAEAAGALLEEKAPLIHSLLDGVMKHLPNEIPDREEVVRLRKVASGVNVGREHDIQWVHSILSEAGGINDNSRVFLPYLCAGFMMSGTWNSVVYDVKSGGFNNNLHCLTRCINAVIGGSEYVRMEREMKRQSISNGHLGEMQQSEPLNRASIEANIKSAMQLFVKCASLIVLDSWTENSRGFIFPKLIFLDQLCEMSPYLPRSTLESHVPYTIIRSIYHQCYSGTFTGPDLTLTGPSPKQSPHISLSHASPAVRPGWVDNAPRSNNVYESGQYVSPAHEETYEIDVGGKAKGGEKFMRSMRRSGPLDYSTSRKVKFAEGSSSSAVSGPSPMQRFAVSRSGPLLYK